MPIRGGCVFARSIRSMRKEVSPPFPSVHPNPGVVPGAGLVFENPPFPTISIDDIPHFHFSPYQGSLRNVNPWPAYFPDDFNANAFPKKLKEDASKWDVISILHPTDLPAILEDYSDRYKSRFSWALYRPHRVARQFGLDQSDPGNLKCTPCSEALAHKFDTHSFLSSYDNYLPKFPIPSHSRRGNLLDSGANYWSRYLKSSRDFESGLLATLPEVPVPSLDNIMRVLQGVKQTIDALLAKALQAGKVDEKRRQGSFTQLLKSFLLSFLAYIRIKTSKGKGVDIIVFVQTYYLNKGISP